MSLWTMLGDAVGIHPDAPALTPEQAHKKKTADYNQKNYGSPTVSADFSQVNETGKTWYQSSLTGQSFATPEEARADEAAMASHSGRYAPGYQDQAPLRAATGQQSPIARGGLGDQVPDGISYGDVSSAAMDRIDANIKSPALAPPPRAPFTSGPRAGFTDEIVATRPAPRFTRDQTTRPSAGTDWDRVDLSNVPVSAGGTQPDTSPGAPAPDIHRDKIDKILSGLGGYQNDIYAMSQDNTGLSEAEAQLNKAHLLATQRMKDDLAANQAGAMGAARSSRSRADRGLLERQAIGEQAYLGTQAQRQQKNLDDQIPLDMAILRAKEEDADKQFRFTALSKAADLGLNTAALEVDIGKANLDSARDWVNNEFQQLGIDKQINNDEAKMLLGFARDMASIQFEYDKLSVDDQNVADQLLMQKYGIDQGTLVAMKKIKEDGKFQWDQVLAGIAGGVGGGLTGGLANLIGGGGDSGTSPSDAW